MRWRKDNRHRVEEELRKKSTHWVRTRRSPLGLRAVFKSPQTTLILLNSSIPILSSTAQREASARHDRLREKEQKQSFRTPLKEEAHQDVSSSSTRAEKWVFISPRPSKIFSLWEKSNQKSFSRCLLT